MSGPTQGGTSVAFVSVYDLNLNAWYSAPETGTATHSCAPGQTGSTSTYTEPQYAFYSYASQNDANSQAQTAANAAATTLAQSGTCSSSCNLVYASGFNSYQATITTTGTGGTGTFTWAFSPSSSFSSGTLGTIPSSCCPSGTRNLTVNDQAATGTLLVCDDHGIGRGDFKPGDRHCPQPMRAHRLRYPVPILCKPISILINLHPYA